ncbi:hypothetical protein I203_104225 [Kwoniella mangroviensis CBS 8507]|uniref:uncharacterized protein n=1 Tax=Kwoniella mangroviensis CBS 8507 TaxID=1296122 RepID=UPI003070A717
MYKQNTQSIGISQLRLDLENLSNEITHVTRRLLGPPSSISPYLPLNPQTSPHRLSRLVSLLPSRSRSLRRKGKYEPIDEKPLLSGHTGDPRNSDDSDTTLVPPGTPPLLKAEDILKEMAQPISNLQRYSNRLHHLNLTVGEYKKDDKEELIGLFKTICTRLIDLLESLKTLSRDKSMFDNDNISDRKDEDNGEMEMRDLMIQALIKKINIELTRFSSPIPSFSLNSSMTKNPFVLHSTSLTTDLTAPSSIFSGSGKVTDYDSEILISPAVSQRRESLSTPRPIKMTHHNHLDREIETMSLSSFSSLDKTVEGEYALSSNNNQNWAQNIIRLGSYQASWLFSNTPVAVMKLGGDHDERAKLI